MPNQEESVAEAEGEREAYAKAYYAKQIQSVLTPEELVFVAQRQWACVLSPNGNMKYYYEFKDVPKGTIIGIEVSEILKERLACKEGLKENRLQVIVR